MKIKHRVAYFKVYDSFDEETFIGKSVVPSSWSVGRIAKGFWLDNFMEITDQDLDAKYWVAPASVIGVENIEEDTDSV